jgi:glucokinase
MDGAMTLVLGLDLGGTNVKCAVIDLAGPEPRVIARATAPNGAEGGEDAVLETVARLGLDTLGDLGAPAVAGLGLPGHFEAATGTGTLLPNLPGDWRGRSIASPVAERLGVPVHLVNDVRALTLAELRLGAGRGVQDLLCVALGTGVGGGIAIGGRLHIGSAHAGEIGHSTVEPDGPLCGCGNRGCLDRVASAEAIARDAGQPTVRDAALAAEAGDERARAAIERAAGYVGRTIANAVVLLYPERVVVGGGVAEAGDTLLDPIRAEVRRRVRMPPLDQIAIVGAELGSVAGAIGAALWAADQAGVDVPAIAV